MSGLAKGMIIRARAPLRLGLAGGGTDVSPYSDEFGGAVLNATIDRYAVASVEIRSDDQVVFCSTDLGQEEQLPLGFPLNTDQGLRLHRATYNRMIAEFNDGAPLPITLTTHVDSPIGSGLGSSSALVVAMVTLFAEALSAPLGEYEIAQIAYEIERISLDLKGGKQDQFSAAFGGFNFMEFGKGDRVVVNPLRITSPTVCELESSMVLFFTGASRESATIIASQSRSIESGGAALDAMHRLKEEAVAMKEALLFGKTNDVAKVLVRGWEAKKATSASVSTPEIERLYSEAFSAGALAGKVSGAGGGGFIFFLADPLKRAAVVKRLRDEPSGLVSFANFTHAGSHAWRVR